jgi:hypothetical protein
LRKKEEQDVKIYNRMVGRIQEKNSEIERRQRELERAQSNFQSTISQGHAPDSYWYKSDKREVERAEQNYNSAVDDLNSYYQDKGKDPSNAGWEISVEQKLKELGENFNKYETEAKTLVSEHNNFAKNIETNATKITSLTDKLAADTQKTAESVLKTGPTGQANITGKQGEKGWEFATAANGFQVLWNKDLGKIEVYDPKVSVFKPVQEYSGKWGDTSNQNNLFFADLSKGIDKASNAYLQSGLSLNSFNDTFGIEIAKVKDPRIASAGFGSIPYNVLSEKLYTEAQRKDFAAKSEGWASNAEKEAAKNKYGQSYNRDQRDWVPNVNPTQYRYNEDLAFVRKMDPNFDPEAYKAINKLGANVDPFDHWMDNGQFKNAYTNYAAAQPEIALQKQRLLDEVAESRGLTTSQLTKDDISKIQTQIDKVYGNDIQSLRTATPTKLQTADFLINEIGKKTSTPTDKNVAVHTANNVGTTYDWNRRAYVPTVEIPQGLVFATQQEIVNNQAYSITNKDGSISWVKVDPNTKVWSASANKTTPVATLEPVVVTASREPKWDELQYEDPLEWMYTASKFTPERRAPASSPFSQTAIDATKKGIEVLQRWGGDSKAAANMIQIISVLGQGGAELVEFAGNTIAAIGPKAADRNNQIYLAGKGIKDYLNTVQSVDSKAQEENIFKAITDAKGFFGTIGAGTIAMAKNPIGVLTILGKEGVQELPAFLAGATAFKIARTVYGLTLTGAATSAKAVYAGSGAMETFGASYGSVRDSVYATQRAAGKSEAEANRIAHEAGVMGGGMSAMVTLGTDFLFDAGLVNRFTGQLGKSLSDSVTGAVSKATVGGFFEGAGNNAAEQIAKSLANTGKVTVDFQQVRNGGAIESFVTGATASGMIGASQIAGVKNSTAIIGKDSSGRNVTFSEYYKGTKTPTSINGDAVIATGSNNQPITLKDTLRLNIEQDLQTVDASKHYQVLRNYGITNTTSANNFLNEIDVYDNSYVTQQELSDMAAQAGVQLGAQDTAFLTGAKNEQEVASQIRNLSQAPATITAPVAKEGFLENQLALANKLENDIYGLDFNINQQLRIYTNPTNTINQRIAARDQILTLQQQRQSIIDTYLPQIAEAGRLDQQSAEQRRLAEQQRLAEEKARADAEAARLAEQQRLAEEQNRIAEAQRLAEQQRLAEAEAARIAEQQRVAEEARRAEEQARLEQQRAEEQARQEAEAARLAEERRLAQEQAMLAEERISNVIDPKLQNLETKLSEEITKAREAGAEGDAALQIALDKVASDLNTTKEDVLGQLGTTEAKLTEQITGVSQDVQTKYDALTAEQKNLADQLTQQGVDLNTAIDTAKTQLSQQITDVSQDVQTKYDALTTEQKNLADQLTQQGVDLNTAIDTAKTEISADVQTKYDTLSELIGRPSRTVTQQDIDTITDIINKTNTGVTPTPGWEGYDINKDGKVDKRDRDLLTSSTFQDTPGTPWAASGIYKTIQDQQRAQQQQAQRLGQQMQRQQRVGNVQQLYQMMRGAPDAAGQQVDVKAPELAKINYFYDVYGPSIFATPQQEQLFRRPFAQGGTVNDLLKILRSK